MNDDIVRRIELIDVLNNLDGGIKDLSKLDKILEKYSNTKKHQNFKVKLLVIKAAVLRQLSLTNYAFATSYYAKYLSDKNNLNIEIEFDPDASIAINYLHEKKEDICREYLESTLKKCKNKNHPFCKYYATILLNEVFEIQTSFFLDSLSNLVDIDTSYYCPWIDNYIDQYVIDNNYVRDLNVDNISQLLSSQDLCHEDFNNIIYLIDKLISANKLIEAKFIIDNLFKCNSFGGNEYQLHYRNQNYLMSKFQSQCNVSLQKIFVAIQNTFKISAKNFDDLNNLHYADFIYGNNCNKMEILFQGYNNNEEWITSKRLIQSLSEIKEQHENVLNSRDIFEGREVSTEVYDNYIKLNEDIHTLEYSLENYEKGIYSELSIFEQLYNLHGKVYAYEKLIKAIPVHKLKMDKEKKKAQITKNLLNGQVLDIIGTENDYYFSYISKDTIIIDKFSKEEIDLSLKAIKTGLRNKSQLGISLESNQRIMNTFKHMLNPEVPNLYIIPDQEFYELPFELLILDISSNFYLSDHYNISYLTNIDQIYQKPFQISDLNVNLFSYSSNTTLQSTAKLEIPEMIYGLEEICDIAELYDQAIVYEGGEFTKKSLSNLSSSIVHFSTHSYSDPSRLFGNFYYARDAKLNGIKVFGFELKNIQFDKSLIILSSCNSGSGVYKPGAGIFSLSRDFFHAGAQTVIKSLWAVNEASTKDLMVKFHKYFSSGKSASMSLTLAKRELKSTSKYSHPYYWAGFVLEGNPNVYLDTKTMN